MMQKANKIVMTIAGLVLIFATITKSHQLLTEPVISEGFWESWEFFMIQIPLELGLGIWLVCGLFRKAAWLIGVLAFGMFIGVTLQKGLVGAESCGCFGTVHVNPWITLSAIDIPFFIFLLVFRPKGYKLLPPPWPSAKHFFGVAIPTFILLAVLTPTLILNRPPDKTDSYEVVKPEEWTREGPKVEKQTSEEQIDKQQASREQTTQEQPSEEWPMLKHIDIADSLRSGIVVVLFYRNDCPNCHEAIPLYDQMSRDLAGNEDAMQIAFVEVPPYGPQQDSPIPTNTPCLTGKLDSSKKWYITTPLIVVILDGSAIKSWEVQTPSLDDILNAVFADG